MERESEHKQNWNRLTLTALRTEAVEEARKRFRSSPKPALFSEECTERDADAYLALIASGCGEKPLTLSALRERVLNRFSEEIHYTSTEEEVLLQRLVLSRGDIRLDDWNDIEGAEGLICRGWCGYESSADGLHLVLPQKLLETASVELSSSKHESLRKHLDIFLSMLAAILYLRGYANEKELLESLMAEIKIQDAGLALWMARRFLQFSSCYVLNDDGSMTLLHPALIHPENYRNLPTQSLELYPPELLAGALQGILPEEIPLHNTLCGVIAFALREDRTAAEVAEDLRFLAKQSISYENLLTVMNHQLITLPTETMKAALKDLWFGVPRWPKPRLSRLN